MSNIEAVHTYFNAWLARDADAVLASLTSNGTYQDPSTNGPISGEALRGYLSQLWAAFPDLSFEIVSVDEIGDDNIAAQWIMFGTNTGSFHGLPPSGKKVEVHGADFIKVENDKLASVKGYFDSGEVPRQLGLNVIVQPFEIGPFKFGTSVSVQTGKRQEPGAFSITQIEANDEQDKQNIREYGRNSMSEMLSMDGFIGATTAAIGNRLVTVSAWDSEEQPRQVIKTGSHAEAIKQFYEGSLGKSGYTSVWEKNRVNPFYPKCESCGKINRAQASDTECACGATFPEQLPYW